MNFMSQMHLKQACRNTKYPPPSDLLRLLTWYPQYQLFPDTDALPKRWLPVPCERWQRWPEDSFWLQTQRLHEHERLWGRTVRQARDLIHAEQEEQRAALRSATCYKDVLRKHLAFLPIRSKRRNHQWTSSRASTTSHHVTQASKGARCSVTGKSSSRLCPALNIRHSRSSTTHGRVTFRNRKSYTRNSEVLLISDDMGHLTPGK